jgi:hypothetical protein
MRWVKAIIGWTLVAIIGGYLAIFVGIRVGLWTLEFLVTYFPWY